MVKKAEDTDKAQFSDSASVGSLRKNKTYQDRLPADQRERVATAQRVRSFSQQHKPRRAKDWLSFRGH